MTSTIATGIALPTFDLSIIISQLCRDREGSEFREMDVGQRTELEKEYRRFLALHNQLPDVPLIPSKIIDKVWHRHILNTKKYAEDCQEYFGYFLHHQPNDLSGDDSSQWKRTLRLYKQFFGEKPGVVWIGESATSNGACCGGDCGTCR